MISAQWQEDSKCSPYLLFTLYLDLTVMQFYKFFHQCQPYTCSFLVFCVRVIRLVETVEDVF